MENTDTQSLIEKIAPMNGERILLIGSVCHGIVADLLARDCKLFLADIDAASLSFLRQEFPLSTFNLTEESQIEPNNSFGGVISHSTLESYVPPSVTITRIKSALKPGGHFGIFLGGNENLSAVLESLTFALVTMGYANRIRSVWYFPNLGAFASQLEKSDLWPLAADVSSRLECVGSREDFSRSILRLTQQILGGGLPESLEPRLMELVEERVEDRLQIGGKWHIDKTTLSISGWKKP